MAMLRASNKMAKATTTRRDRVLTPAIRAEAGQEKIKIGINGKCRRCLEQGSCLLLLQLKPLLSTALSELI